MAAAEYAVASSASLADGTMRRIELAGRKILLARVSGRCHAVGATCPHAGANLADGVLRDGIVVCPWHKAAFRVATGERTEPPALDHLPCFPVREADGQIRVSLVDAPDRIDPAPVTQTDDAPVHVIIGAGAAGAVAAQTLREFGFSGRIVMIGREDQLPYDRTVLSKYALSGQQGGEKTPLQDAAFYDRHRIERRTAEVTRVDPATRTVRFADATTLTYDAALLATGGIPRPLTIPGADLPGVFLLRSAADGEAIVAAAAHARRVVVIGAGFIAMEAAASLRERGLEVTVTAPQKAPFERQLGAQIGEALRRLHERQGVAFRLGRQATAIQGDGRVRSVTLDDDTTLPADLVVAGLGVAPATDLLHGLHRRRDGSIAVDAQLRAAADLYAAGDIAAFPLHGDGEPIRVEHWRVAQQHGRVAALNMLGRPTRYDAVPYFWTIQYLKRLDYVGHAERWDDLVFDGDLDKPEFLAFYLQAGRVAAIAGWDRDRQMAASIPLMTERRDWTVPMLREALLAYA